MHRLHPRLVACSPKTSNVYISGIQCNTELVMSSAPTGRNEALELLYQVRSKMRETPIGQHYDKPF